MTHHCCVADRRRRAELPGPNIPLPCGYQPVAEHFAEGLDIRFGQRVQRVAYDGAGVRVTTEDGGELAADAVIVTVSLGVLKARAAPSAQLRRGVAVRRGTCLSGRPRVVCNWFEEERVYHLSC